MQKEEGQRHEKGRGEIRRKLRLDDKENRKAERKAMRISDNEEANG